MARLMGDTPLCVRRTSERLINQEEVLFRRAQYSAAFITCAENICLTSILMVERSTVRSRKENIKTLSTKNAREFIHHKVATWPRSRTCAVSGQYCPPTLCVKSKILVCHAINDPL